MPIPDDIKEDELLALLKAYDEYIQSANDEKRYDTGWMPVCINEFYDNEWQDILTDEKKKKEFVVHMQKCRGCNKKYPRHILGIKVKWCPYCGQTSRNSEETKVMEYGELQEAARLNGKWL